MRFNQEIVDKFNNGYIPEPNSGCWLWIGKPRSNQAGYGYVCVGNGKMEAAHRLSFMLHKGSIAEDHHIHHECENQSCVNPSHLKCMYSEDHGRHRHARAVNKTKCKGNKHDLTDPSSYILYRGNRTCLQCCKENEEKLRRSSEVGDARCPMGHIYDNENSGWLKRPYGFDRFCRECSRLKAVTRQHVNSQKKFDARTEMSNISGTCKNGHARTKDTAYVGKGGHLQCLICFNNRKNRSQYNPIGAQ